MPDNLNQGALRAALKILPYTITTKGSAWTARELARMIAGETGVDLAQSKVDVFRTACTEALIAFLPMASEANLDPEKARALSALQSALKYCNES